MKKLIIALGLLAAPILTMAANNLSTTEKATYQKQIAKSLNEQFAGQEGLNDAQKAAMSKFADCLSEQVVNNLDKADVEKFAKIESVPETEQAELSKKIAPYLATCQAELQKSMGAGSSDSSTPPAQ